MLKCISVYTYEIDSPETALEEIKAQLDDKITLLENTIGIIMCHTEFLISGVVKYLSDKLPFPLAGATTSSQAVSGQAGELILTIFVMTSDDIKFKAGVTGSIEENIDLPLEQTFTEINTGMNEGPKLAIIFPPMMLKYAGDAYVNAWKSLIPGVPVFGSLAVDDTLNFKNNETIFNGDSYKASMSFVLCYGNINPRFLVATLPQNKALPYKGEITKSSGPYVQEINGINAYSYFESIGFASKGALSKNYIFVPFVIDQKNFADCDGIPVVRGHASFTEDGTAIFRGNVLEGSVFTMLNCDSDDVLSTTKQKVMEINQIPDVSGILIYSCIVRQMITQRISPLKELETIRETINPGTPFMAAYSGGEICPTSFKNGIPANRFHNYSLVAVVL